MARVLCLAALLLLGPLVALGQEEAQEEEPKPPRRPASAPT